MRFKNMSPLHWHSILWSHHPHLTAICRRTHGVLAKNHPVLLWPLDWGVPSMACWVSALEMPREWRPRRRTTLNKSHRVCQLPLLLMLPLILFVGMLMNIYEWCQKEAKSELLHAILIQLCFYSHNKTTVL